MGSRSEILVKIKANKPDTIELPRINTSVFYEGLDLAIEFTKKVEAVGGTVYHTSNNIEVITKIKELFPEAKINFSTLKNTEEFNTISLADIKQPHKLEDLDVLVLESSLGVAENGAVWIEDSKIPMRVCPFITKHLVLVLEEKVLVPYMHQAYKNIGGFDFGVFISGPSKTADIEQSLVIGAHGALSLSVFLY
ncbi:LutC/YkgG family protein [Yeosuana marina]|uniref:LutC/YkgG family protein n=1 Tax=Yeosuana marina TaxID=1565536 RepID=UPI0030C85C6F